MNDRHTPGYEVTRDGRVYSVSHNWRGFGRRELVQRIDPSGYPSVRLTINGVRKRYTVHRLLALKFLGSPPTDRHEIRHIDGDKTNNALDNLAWGTRQENADDREAHGRTSRGSQHVAKVREGRARSTNPRWKHVQQGVPYGQAK